MTAGFTRGWKRPRRSRFRASTTTLDREYVIQCRCIHGAVGPAFQGRRVGFLDTLPNHLRYHTEAPLQNAHQHARFTLGKPLSFTFGKTFRHTLGHALSHTFRHALSHTFRHALSHAFGHTLRNSFGF